MPAHRNLTPEVARVICESVRAGGFRNTACALAGVSDRSLRRWLEKAESGEELYVAFAEQLREAEAVSEKAAIDRIRQLVVEKLDWKSESWILSKRFPSRFGDRVDLSAGDSASNTKIEVRVLRVPEKDDT